MDTTCDHLALPERRRRSDDRRWLEASPPASRSLTMR